MEPTEQDRKTRAANIRAVWEALLSPRWDRNIRIDLGKALYARRSLKDLETELFERLLPRLVEIVEVLESKFKPAAASPLLTTTPNQVGPEEGPGVTGAAGPGPCPTGAPGPVGPSGCTTGPTGPGCHDESAAAPTAQPATRRVKRDPGEVRNESSKIFQPGTFHPTSPASPGATLPPAHLGVPTPPPPQDPDPASESAAPGPGDSKE
jgi:hypothetical protein